MHGVSIPVSKYGIYMDWSQNPYGGAGYLWNPFAKPWEVAPYMRHPFKDVPLYITGEAFASKHGWIESAINASEKLLQEQFGLPKARWIPSDYNLGD